MRRCSQCWREQPDDQFVGARGLSVNWCAGCRARWRGGSYQRQGRPAALVRSDRGPIRVGWTLRSRNRKTGPIPVSISSPETCPKSCRFYGAGCYAEFGWVRARWKDVTERGLTWAAFCQEVAQLPPGTLWRHNEAGDLPGRDGRLDVRKLARLVAANRGRRGFSFTHKELRRPSEWRAVLDANLDGFTINLSADDLQHADLLADLGAGPVAVVLPRDTPDRGTHTPAGRRVVVCPAETRELTCAQCRLCAKPWRKAIVGFRAHGQMAAHVSQLVRLRPRRAA